MKKRWVALLLVTALVCESNTIYAKESKTVREVSGSIPVESEFDITEEAVNASKIEGTEVYWSISDGVLTIATSGDSAALPDYADGYDVPWVKNRSEVRKIVVQSGITGIGDYAFSNMRYLEEVEIQSKTLTTIGAHAFEGCDVMRKINLPDSVNDMGVYAFAKCTNLKEISQAGFVTPKNLKEIPEYAFAECEEIENVTISQNVEKISMCAFYSCGGLKEVEFAGNKLACIEEYAFADSGLTAITLPKSVSEIYAYAFSGCHSLKKVGFLTSGNDSLQIENDVFDNCGIVAFYTFGTGAAYDYVSTYYPDKHVAYISFSNESNFDVSIIGDTTYTGAQIQPKVKIKYRLNNNLVLVEGEDYTLSYDNNVDAGKQAVITIKGKNGYQGSMKVNFTIAPANLKEQAEVNNIPAQSYTGKAITPTVKVKVNGVALKKNVDYRVTYSNNVKVGDNASVTIEGIGNYTGSVVKKFAIKSDISDNNSDNKNDNVSSVAKATVTVKKQSYTGKALKPKVTVVVDKKTLKAGTDYKVTYANNKKIGKKAKVTITGIGNYKGSITKYFTIVPPKAKVKVRGNKLIISNYVSGADVYLTYKVSGKSKTTTLLWKAKKYKAKKCVDLTQLKKKYKGKKLTIKVYMKVNSLEGTASGNVSVK